MLAFGVDVSDKIKFCLAVDCSIFMISSRNNRSLSTRNYWP